MTNDRLSKLRLAAVMAPLLAATVHGCAATPHSHAQADGAAPKAAAASHLDLPSYSTKDAVAMGKLAELVYQFGDGFHPYYATADEAQADITGRMTDAAQSLGYTMSSYALKGSEADTGEVFGAIFTGADHYVVVFRGTVFSSAAGQMNNNDWGLINSPFSEGQIHHGFFSVEEKLWPMVEAFFAAKEHQDKPIWITGHSLGSAVATLTATKMHKQMPSLNVEKIYTFGTPRAGDADFWQDFANLGLEQRFVKFSRYNDIVNSVPLTILGYGDTRNVVLMNADESLTHQDVHTAYAGMSFDYGTNTSLLKTFWDAKALTPEETAAMNAMIGAIWGSPVTNKEQGDGIMTTLEAEMKAGAATHDIKSYVQIISDSLAWAP